MRKALLAVLVVFALAGCTDQSGSQATPAASAPASSPAQAEPTAAAPDPAATDAPATPDPATPDPAAEPPADAGVPIDGGVVPGATEEPSVGGWTPQLAYDACTGAIDKAFDSGTLTSRADASASSVHEQTEGIWTVAIPVERKDLGQGTVTCTVQGTTDQPVVEAADSTEQ